MAQTLIRTRTPSIVTLKLTWTSKLRVMLTFPLYAKMKKVILSIVIQKIQTSPSPTKAELQRNTEEECQKSERTESQLHCHIGFKTEKFLNWNYQNLLKTFYFHLIKSCLLVRFMKSSENSVKRFDSIIYTTIFCLKYKYFVSR